MSNLDPFSILYGKANVPRINKRPGLDLFVPPDNLRIDKRQLEEIIYALSLFTLSPKDHRRIEPLNNLHRRLRKKVEIIVGTEKELSANSLIDFTGTQMACRRLPDGLLEFKLKWNEWDMIMAALSFAVQIQGQVKEKSTLPTAGDPVLLYGQLCKGENGQTAKPESRQGMINCVQCGKALTIDQAAVDDNAYRCPTCPETE